MCNQIPRKLSSRFLGYMFIHSKIFTTGNKVYPTKNLYKQETTVRLLLTVGGALNQNYTYTAQLSVAIVQPHSPVNFLWCQLTLMFIICFVLQVCQIKYSDTLKICEMHTPLSILRSPRAFIMVRPVRVYLKFQLPKTKIRSIFM